MPYDVFISYSHKDHTAADAACAILESEGVRCWIAPRDVPPGSEWGGSIARAIEACRVLLVIISSTSNKSRQVHREVERAVSKGLAVLPLNIERIDLDPSLEYFIGAVHWLDALTPPLEQHLRKLVPAVKALLDISEMEGSSVGNPSLRPRDGRTTDQVNNGATSDRMSRPRSKIAWMAMLAIVPVVIGLLAFRFLWPLAPANTAPSDDLAAGRLVFEERLESVKAQTGDLQISLIWDGDSDLDLRVVCPTGEEITFRNRRVCGGMLDIDSNAEVKNAHPVENVFWPRGSVPDGQFQVLVSLYQRGNDRRPKIPFKVRVKYFEQERLFDGEIGSTSEPMFVTQFRK